MKKLLLVVLAAVVLVGCGDGMTSRERTCMELSGDAVTCLGRAPGFGPSAPGNYTNYYGSPQHGSWVNGQYLFTDPHGHYASSTNSFLMGSAVGGLAAYMLTSSSNRSNWDNDNRGGYQERTRTNTKYLGKGGKEISKTEYTKRKAQSDSDKARNVKAQKSKAQKAKVAQAKKAKATQAQKASTVKANSTDGKAARLAAVKAKKAARLKATKAPTKPLSFTKSSSTKSSFSKKSSYSKTKSHKRK